MFERVVDVSELGGCAYIHVGIRGYVYSNDPNAHLFNNCIYISVVYNHVKKIVEEGI